MHRHEINEYLMRAVADLGAIVLTANEATAQERLELDSIRSRLRQLATRFKMLSLSDIRGSEWTPPPSDVTWT